MRPLPVSELIDAVGGTVVGCREHLVCTGVGTDSRTIAPGDCFFAIAGPTFDGHDYVASVFERGAVCAVVRRQVPDVPRGRCVIRVGDTVKALGRLARHCRTTGGFKVAAITGSVGKTTVRQMTFTALSRRFAVHQSPKNFNNDIGLPLTLLSAPADSEMIVAELGTNHPGEIGVLTRIARPDAAVVTNVYAAHLEGFGTVENIAGEKLSIADGLDDDGRFIVNGDIEMLPRLCRAAGRRFLTFGRGEGRDYRAVKVVAAGSGSTFTLVDGPADATAVIDLPLPGPGNIENALAAYALCAGFGIGGAEFAAAVAGLTPVAMRAELLTIGAIRVLSDCYNANPASMANALSTLVQVNTDGRRTVFICGDMAELGPTGEALHEELGRRIADGGIDVLLTAGPLSRATARAARLAAHHDLRIASFDDTVAACNNMQDFVKDGDIVLVKGSRSAKLELAVDKLRELFSPDT